jgi:UDP-2,3-diacylglucosamine pyrophosphatase LpxH
MLVIISDLHLTDGTSGASIPPGAFAVFAERLQDLAIRASWRANGTYRPIEQIDVILLGDILDVIRSSTWLTAGDARPWDDPTSPQVVEMASRITADVLQNNAGGLAVLRDLASVGGVRVPAAYRDGRPVWESAASSRREPDGSTATYGDGAVAPVRIHYMVGNHDWFYHVRGPAYDALRRTVVERMGLANPADTPFPHDPLESDAVLEVLRKHKVLARHGDVYDPFNFEQDRDASSMGDALIIELLNRFTSEVEVELGEDLPAAVVLGLREIDNVRPLLLVPVWMDGLLERACPASSMRKRVKQIWDRMADDFLSLDFVRDRDTWGPLDLVDGLERALKFTRRLSVGWASSIVTWLEQFRGGGEETYYRFALAEQDFRNRRAKHIVYGHTHAAESVPLDACYAEGCVQNQVYLNSGTWRRMHRQTRLDPQEHEFIASDAMTYLAFFQGNERGGRPYESWTGTLGVDLPDAMTHRVDAAHDDTPRPRHAKNQPVSVPAASGQGLHFHAAADRAPIVPMRRVR